MAERAEIQSVKAYTSLFEKCSVENLGTFQSEVQYSKMVAFKCFLWIQLLTAFLLIHLNRKHLNFKSNNTLLSVQISATGNEPIWICYKWHLVSLSRISLNVMQLNVESQKVYTVQGVPISVTGIAQVCIKVFLWVMQWYLYFILFQIILIEF